MSKLGDVVWLRIPEGYYLAKDETAGSGAAHLAFERRTGVWKLHLRPTDGAVVTYPPGKGVQWCIMEAARYLSRLAPVPDAEEVGGCGRIGSVS